jgi:hypothetical protein
MALFNDTGGSTDYGNYITRQQNTPNPAPVGQTPPATDINNLISQAYAGIGRSDTGTGLGAVTQGEKDYWAGQVASGAINPTNFQSVFNNSVNSYKAANPNDAYTQYVNDYQAKQIPTTFSGNAYLAANPDVAAAYQAAPGGLDADAFAKLHYSTYGINEQRLADPNAIYNKLVKDAYATNLGLDPNTIDATNEGLNYWKGQLASGAVKPQDFNSVFNNAVDAYIAANPNDTYSQKALDIRKTNTENTGLKDYATSVFGDTTLSAADQANKIIDQARQKGYDQTRLEQVLGKDKAQPLYDAYKKNINDFLTTTLAQEPGTTMNEVGAIHKQALDHNMTVDDLVKYGGLDKKVAQSYFDMYDKGLGSLISQLNDPKNKYDDVAKTQNLLGLQQKYGTTDAELAKAIGGKATVNDVKAYLDPIRNLQTDLQKMMTDSSYTAEDVQKKIDEARKDPRAAGIYGVALDKISQNMPAFALRDAQSGNRDLVTSYQDFLTKAKATPASAAQYAPQIAAVENILKNAQYSANDVFGGKIQNYQLQLMSSLTDKAKKAIPQQLEFTQPPSTQQWGEDGYYTYTPPPKLKTPGIEQDEDGNFYQTKPVNVNGEEVFANYDNSGKLVGYYGNPRQATWLDGHHYITGNWDAQGNAKPATHGSYNSGFVGGMLQDIGSNPLGMLMLAAATGGLSGLASEALLPYLGESLAGAAGSGLVGGTMAGLQGQDILKGAVGGGLGNLAGRFVGGLMPPEVGADGGMGSLPVNAGITGNSMVDSYLTKGIPKAVGAVTNSLVNNGNAGQAGITSLLNSGINLGLGNTDLGLDNLPEGLRPYATGIASNLITSGLTGKPTNLTNAAISTALQEAISANKPVKRI